jgi:hypothetical protein
MNFTFALVVLSIYQLGSLSLTESFKLKSNYQVSYSIRSDRSSFRMLFDFFRQRTQEGIDQVKNIATKTLEGKFGEALMDTAGYIRERNRIDTENLKQLTIGLSRSRDRLLRGISESFSGEDSDLTSRLAKLEDVLLQAGLSMLFSIFLIVYLQKILARLQPPLLLKICETLLVQRI